MREQDSGWAAREAREGWWGPLVPRRVKRMAQETTARRVRAGLIPPPCALPCTDCFTEWEPGTPRHHYDHYLGYEDEHWADVEAVCPRCHNRRSRRRGEHR